MPLEAAVAVPLGDPLISERATARRTRRHANGVKIRPLHFPICEDEAAFQESADSTIKRIKHRDPDDGKGITR